MQVKHLVGSLYTTPYCLYNKKYSQKIKDISPVLNDLIWFSAFEFLKLKTYPIVCLKPFRGNNGPVYKFGIMNVNGVIIIDPKFKPETIIRALAHELIHYHQFDRGDLSYDKNSNKLIWKGQSNETCILPGSASNDEVEMYLNVPWEMEAHSKDKELLTAWVDRTIDQGDARLLKFIKKISVDSEAAKKYTEVIVEMER